MKIMFYGLDKDCVPTEDELKREIMREGHDSSFSAHFGSTKMYRDLNQNF